jgi:hypothetical protein
MITASSDMIDFTELERRIGEQGLQAEAGKAGLIRKKGGTNGSEE